VTPEALLLRVCLLLVASAIAGLWALRDGTAISRWLDGEVADSGYLPHPDTPRRLDTWA
jgi:hypothetical protein